MPEDVYVRCDTCSVVRNVRSAPRCPVCIMAELMPKVPRGERRPSGERWMARAAPENVLPYLSPDQLADVRTPLDAINVVVNRYETPIERILGHNRNRQATAARFELAYLLSRKLGLSSPSVGRVMQRDHSTVLYAIFQYQRGLSTGSQPEEAAAPSP